VKKLTLIIIAGKAMGYTPSGAITLHFGILDHKFLLTIYVVNSIRFS